MKSNFLIITILILFTGCYESDNIYVNYPQKSYNNKSYNNKSNAKYKNRKIQKPYCVLGRWYCPAPTYKGEVFTGVASWYGPNFHGKLTANGEVYNMYAYTAANKTLPLGTVVEVTNLNNNKSVVVRVNDRGPFVKERIIDLSYAAGKKIGIDKTGTAPVKIVVLSTPISTNKINIPQKKNLKKLILNTPVTIKPKISSNINTKAEKNGKISIQIGAFSSLNGANIIKEKYKSLNPYIKKINNIYKVYVGHFNSRDEAVKFKTKYNLNGFLVRM